MILAIECLAACALFTAMMVGGVLWNRTAFLHEYAPEVQKRFLERHPDFKPKAGRMGGIALLVTKLLVCLLFIAILTALIWLAGARSFLTGTLYTAVIWTVVNWYDVFALDIGIFAHWKKVRLPGTEDMDAAYCSNAARHIRDGWIGMLIGVPVSCICGLLVQLFAS